MPSEILQPTEKDQTYALYRLTQEQLGAMLLPIGEYTKDEVRKIAEAVDGFVAKKVKVRISVLFPMGIMPLSLKERAS